jgi:hypothetical protein
LGGDDMCGTHPGMGKWAIGPKGQCD